MFVLDPGHQYQLNILDGSHMSGDKDVILTFVKRQGTKYPGNTGQYPGTNMQEVLRAIIDRLHYVDNQLPHPNNSHAIRHLRSVIYLLELRAAERHQRKNSFMENFNQDEIEKYPTCHKCGHIGCGGECHP